MSLPVTPESYEPFLNQSFEVVGPAGPALPITLTQVSRRIDDEVQLAFIVAFEGPAPLLPQGLYHLKHPQLEVNDLLLVPSARTKTGFRYDATFNLLKEPQ